MPKHDWMVGMGYAFYRYDNRKPCYYPLAEALLMPR
jgi:hypothetical protein